VLVGRDGERRTLERLLAGARVGTSGVLVITGEPGIGKTALLAEARDLAAGMRVLSVRGVEAEQGLAFGGLHQLCAPLLGLLPELPPPQAEALGVALALKAGARPERFAVGAALLGLLTRAAEDSPLAVFVDDAQLLDGSSIQAIVFAARRLQSDPVAVVAAQRDDPTSGLANLGTLRLSPLDVEATRELVEGSGHLTSADRWVARFHQATGGNPLAILELGGEAERLLAAPPHSPLPLAGELREAFLRRVRTLSPDARQLLLVAAADSHDLPTLQLAGARLGLSLKDLEEAESAGLVRLTGQSVEFRHPLVRAAVYGAAEPAARREVHRVLADCVEPVERGRHAWHRAEAALGPDEEAAALLESAAEDSAQRGANAEAAWQFERAAALTSDVEPRATRLLRAGEQAWLAGATDRATGLLHRSLDLATTVHNRARAMRRLGEVESSSGSLRRARELQLAAAELSEQTDPILAAQALADAVWASVYLCDSAKARQLGERLLAMTGPSSPGIVNHLGHLAAGVSLVLGGEADRGPALIRTALAHRPDGDAADSEWHMRWAMVAPLFLREAGSNREAVAQVVHTVRERAGVGVLPFLLPLIAKDAAASTSWAAADEMYAEAVALAEETEHPVDHGFALAGWSMLQARQGRTAEATAHAREALRLGSEHELHLARLWASWALADSCAGDGRMGEAVAAYEVVAQLLDELQLSDPDLSPVPELVECRRQTGSAPDVVAQAAAFLDHATRKAQPWALARAHRAMALALGDERSDQQFTAALELHDRTPDAYETARTQLSYGAHLRRTRRRAEARPLLRAALVTFEQLGALPWADRAAAELDATGETAVRHGASAVNALTPQERQIATLLAAGRTTREAAAALFLSPKTVEYHLRHVYLKLDIRSRAELAALMADS
jgi:DNA-binding CsgD family transcriptional regulator